MEADIKILEELISWKGKSVKIRDYEITAIENLIKGYRELEEELKREKIWRIRLEKENEDTCNEVNNNYIRKSLVIPKSKIKEKIEEINEEEKELQNTISDKEREEYSDANIGYGLMVIENKRQVLQELLEEE